MADYLQPASLQAKQANREISLLENTISSLILACRDGINRLPITERQHEASECIRRAVFLLIEETQDRKRIMGKAARQRELGEYRQRLEGDYQPPDDMPPLLEG